MKQNGAELIVNFLVSQGVRTVTGIPGGSNLPLYDALQRSNIGHVLARHEQGAGFIAQGMARSTGRTAVCLASSGPGSTNLATPLADAYMDSIPVLAITGQVPTSLIGTMAFQEVDTVSIMRPIVKAALRPRTIFELPGMLRQAWQLCTEGRPGPVLIDIPKDVQQAEIPSPVWFDEERVARDLQQSRISSGDPSSEPGSEAGQRDDGFPGIGNLSSATRATIRRIAERIQHASRPILYAGGGIVQSGAAPWLGELARGQDIPVALTLMGLGIFDPDHPLYLGMLGMHGNRSTNHAMEEADLVLAIGVRFDDRATGIKHEFARKAEIIHVDVDAAEIGKNRAVQIGLRMDAGIFLQQLLPILAPTRRPEWTDRVRSLREEDHVPAEWEENSLHPVHIINAISRNSAPDTIFTTDVGQHQMWAARHLPIRAPRSFLTSGGLGTMGFGVPAAIGASLAHPTRPVVCITGDGSLFMNIQELSTIAELQPNLKIIVFNNNHLGLVRQQQDLFYNKNYFAIRYDRPADYAMVASAMGIPGKTAREDDDVDHLIGSFLQKDGPGLLSLPIDETLHVLPMVPPGRANVQAILSV